MYDMSFGEQIPQTHFLCLLEDSAVEIFLYQTIGSIRVTLNSWKRL